MKANRYFVQYHHSFPRAHFLSLLHAETQLQRSPLPSSFKHHTYLTLPYRFQLSIHINTGQLPYIKPALPYRRIPLLPPLSPSSLADRTVLETDWEAMYRVWKQGLGWRNRGEMFLRCGVWLKGFQEGVWNGRVWGRTANYVVTPRVGRVENALPVAEQEDVVMDDGGEGGAGGQGDVPGYLAQFQWPS